MPEGKHNGENEVEGQGGREVLGPSGFIHIPYQTAEQPKHPGNTIPLVLQPLHFAGHEQVLGDLQR